MPSQPDYELTGFAGHLVKDFLRAHDFPETLKMFSKEMPDSLATVKNWSGASTRLRLPDYVQNYATQVEFTQTLRYMSEELKKDSLSYSEWSLMQEKILSENEYRDNVGRTRAFESLIEILLDFWVNASDRVRNALLDQALKRATHEKKQEEKRRLFQSDHEAVNEKIKASGDETLAKSKKSKPGMLMAELDAVFADHVTITIKDAGLPPPPTEEDEESMSPRTLRRHRAKQARQEHKRRRMREETNKLYELKLLSNAPSKGPSEPNSFADDQLVYEIDDEASIHSEETVSEPDESRLDELRRQEEKVSEEIEKMRERLEEKKQNSSNNLMRLRALQDWRSDNFEFQFRKQNLPSDLFMLDQKFRVIGTDLQVVRTDMDDYKRRAKLARRSSQNMKKKHEEEEEMTPIRKEITMQLSKLGEIPPRPFGEDMEKECALCCVKFTISNLPGEITHKSIFELRRLWGLEDDCNPRSKAPLCYDKTRVCRFCFQFFEVPFEKRLQREEEEEPAKKPTRKSMMTSGSDFFFQESELSQRLNMIAPSISPSRANSRPVSRQESRIDNSLMPSRTTSYILD